MGKIVFDWTGLPAPVVVRRRPRGEVRKRRRALNKLLENVARRLYTQRYAMSSLFAGLRAIYFDWAGLATGTIIVYNLRKPRRGAVNLRKFWKIWAK